MKDVHYNVRNQQGSTIGDDAGDDDPGDRTAALSASMDRFEFRGRARIDVCLMTHFQIQMSR